MIRRPGRRYVVVGTVVAAAAGVALLAEQLWMPGFIMLGVATLTTVVVGLALLARPHVIVVDRSAWRAVARSCLTIVAAWPELRDVTGINDVAPVIQRARWELAQLLAERDSLSEMRNEATFAEYGLDPDDQLRRDLALRREQLAQRIASMNAEITGRTGSLQTLAASCAHFAHDRTAQRRAPTKSRRARQAMETADTALQTATPWEVRPDPTLAVSERTDAVLTAYLELATHQP